MSGSPNIPGQTALRISRATRGGWVCDQCGQPGEAHQVAVFIGAVRGAKGILLHGKCAGLHPSAGASIKRLVELMEKNKEAR